MDNVFLREVDFYQRDLDPIRQYIEQSALYISRIKAISYQVACDQIETRIKNKTFPGIHDPQVQYFERPNFEDKEIVFQPLSLFLSTINTENLTTAPSMTCYAHATQRPSLLSGFMDDNVKLRNVAKNEASKQKALGNKDLAVYFTNEQENKKLVNNAASGAMISGGSVINNITGHSSLTSTVRTMTSLGNASNERLISGNRHYRNPAITLNNIVVLAQHTNAPEIRETLSRFGIVYPTIEQTMECINFSTDLYWKDRNKTQKILEFVKTCTDEERASIVYTGDLYHLRKFNNQFVRDLIMRLSRKITDRTFEDPIGIIKKADESHVNYVHHICMSEVKGIGKDYLVLSPELRNTIAATCENIAIVLEDYRLFIKTFFLTFNLPCSVAYIRDSIRRTVVLSDTDSTMFSCDEWVQWYFGKLIFTDESYGVSGAVMFMTTQCIAHNLAIFSANLNVEREKLFMAAMKPEFVFSVFGLTSVGKHYYTSVIVKEGSVYREPELELKGVHLKNSAAPKLLMKDIKTMAVSILDTVVRGELISLTYWVNHVLDLENEVRRSILAGETTFLGRLNIKTADAYKESEELSNFRHHILWNEIFGPKYGLAPPPAYTSVKFPSLLSSKKAINQWISTMDDEELRNRTIRYFQRTGRDNLNTIYVAQEQIDAYGIPKEIKAIIDVESLILQHMGAHRLMLETLGYFPKQGINISTSINPS